MPLCPLWWSFFFQWLLAAVTPVHQWLLATVGVTMACCGASVGPLAAVPEGAAGFAALVFGWVRRDPGSPASGVRAVPVISEARAVARPVAPPEPPAAAPAAIAGESDGPGAEVAAIAVAPSAAAQRTKAPHTHRRINRAPTAARRAVVDELEPSPYKR